MNSGSDDSSRYLKKLIHSLKIQGILKSPEVEKALAAIKREEFLWPGTPWFEAYFDEPIPLGNTGQTISAPHMITIMLEELEIRQGMRILEIGSGSGYNAALLGWLVSGQKSPISPLIISIERNRELVEFARNNIEKIGLTDAVKIIHGDGSLGHPERSRDQMYDRILVTAASPFVPHYLEKQLKFNGILEIPVGGMGAQTLLKMRKEKLHPGTAGTDYAMQREEITGCIFVPLIGEEAYSD